MHYVMHHGMHYGMHYAMPVRVDEAVGDFAHRARDLHLHRRRELAAHGEPEPRALAERVGAAGDGGERGGGVGAGDVFVEAEAAVAAVLPLAAGVAADASTVVGVLRLVA